MSFQTAITIQKAIDNINSQKYLLPAIQREFVWHAGQITRLFDSLMREYPINSFLFWQIKNENKYNFKFYRFLQQYRERYGTHNPEANVEGITDISAVLDGQQRLTSLYIGLTGTYAYKRSRVWWADNEYVLPPRRLYLNISRELVEQDMVYDFQWRIEKENPLVHDTPYHIAKNGHVWFLVGRILDFQQQETLDEFLDRQDFGEDKYVARRLLRRLWLVIHEKPVISYYLEESQDVDKVVDIFIRTNAGGTQLSFSDLLLSMATSGWRTLDARKEIYGLVDEINRFNYSFNKDFVLKTLLVLLSKDIRFKINNFNTTNIDRFEENWAQARQCIVTSVRLVCKLGFNTQVLRSHNAVIPIVYYLFKKHYGHDFDTAVRYKDDRKTIAKYLHIVLLTKLFSGQSDWVLTTLREAIDDSTAIPLFPLVTIINRCKAIGRDISFSEEFGRGLLRTEKDDSYTFSILALLYPGLGYNNTNYDKDHLHPISQFSEPCLDEMGIMDPENRRFFLDRANNNSILNLQLLSANENKQKQGQSLQKWVEQYQPHLDAHLIPSDVSLDFVDFEKFIEERERLLLEKLESMWHD